MSHFKPLAALVATLLALGAHAQAPSASPLSATCKPWVVVADASVRDTANLPAEFGTASVAEFQAEWRKRLEAPSLNPAFPHARLYARTFETGDVAYLYERAVLQADAGALAMLLRLHESSQPGIRADALAAIAFAHFQWNTPASKTRGLALIEEALKGQGSYPAAVFRGRAHVWGGDYAAKNLSAAMGFLAQAGRIPDERQSAGRRLDATNLQDLHAATLRHLLAHEPNAPSLNFYAGPMKSAQEIEGLQGKFRTEFERAPAFSTLLPALNRLDAALKAPAAVAPGFARLREALAAQERMAQGLYTSTPADAAQAAALAPVQAANEALLNALQGVFRQVINEQMNDRGDFPQILRRVQVINALQIGLSRSCSLAATWTAARN